jgi:hydrogenase maturation factor
LPLGTTEDEVRALFEDMARALDHLEVTLVGGHTEITAVETPPSTRD